MTETWVQYWWVPFVTLIAVFCLFLVFADKLMKKEYGARFLVITAFIVFVFTLFSISDTSQYPFSPQAIDALKNFINIAIGLAPIGFSVRQCRKYWAAMENEVTETEDFNSIYPTLMVAQGTFYTFVGVASILFAYNTQQNNDIAILLGGLKLAFITSIIGLAYSIAAKNYLKKAADQYFSQKKEGAGLASSSVDEIDFYKQLNNIKHGIGDLYTQSLSIDRRLIKNNDIFNEQNSLITSQNDLLKESFSEAMRNAGEIITNQNREVLQEAAAEFKRIIVDASQKNKDIMNQMMEDHQKSRDLIMTTLADTLNTVKDSANDVNTTLRAGQEIASGFNETLKSINTSVTYINNSILGLGEPLKDTHTALSAIKDKSEDIAEIFVSLTGKYQNIETCLVENLKTFQSMKNVLQQMNDDITNSAQQNVESFQSMKDILQQTSQAVSDNVKQSVEESAQAIADMNESYKDKISDLNTLIAKLSDNMKEQADAIKEYSMQLNLVSKDAAEQDKIIQNGHDAIVREFGKITDKLNDLNAEYNNEMLNAQKKYNEMMQQNLSDCISIVSDVLRHARDRYVSDISAIESNVDTIQKQLNESRSTNEGSDN